MDVMVALVGALASIVSYASQASEATVKSANPEVDRFVRAMEMPLNSGHFRRPFSRYEIAVILNAGYSIAEQATKTFASESDAYARDGWSLDGETHREAMNKALRQLRAFRESQPTYQRLLVSFRKELSDLGVEDTLPQAATAIARRSLHLHPPIPGEAFLPFPDVPAGHWAAGALQTLRKARIVRGYPDGRFGG
jgi:hypothetical protein